MYFVRLYVERLLGNKKLHSNMGELKVYYGWAKVGKIRKKRAISVMFENEWHGCRCERGQRILRAASWKIMNSILMIWRNEYERCYRSS